MSNRALYLHQGTDDTVISRDRSYTEDHELEPSGLADIIQDRDEDGGDVVYGSVGRQHIQTAGEQEGGPLDALRLVRESLTDHCIPRCHLSIVLLLRPRAPFQAVFFWQFRVHLPCDSLAETDLLLRIVDHTTSSKSQTPFFLRPCSDSVPVLPLELLERLSFLRHLWDTGQVEASCGELLPVFARGRDAVCSSLQSACQCLLYGQNIAYDQT